STLSPLLQRARSPAVHTSGSVQLPGLPVSVQRHLGDPLHGTHLPLRTWLLPCISWHFHSWCQCSEAVPVARDRLPERLAPGASEPLSGRDRLSLESAQSRGPGRLRNLLAGMTAGGPISI